MLIFCLLNNILYKSDYDNEGNYKYLEQENIEEQKEELQKELLNYDKNNANQISMYITIKTKIDILSIKEKFSCFDWQYNKINDYLYDDIYQKNYEKFITKNEIKLNEIKEQLNFIIKKLNNNDWQYFLNIEKNKYLNEQKKLQEEYNITTEEKTKIEIQKQLEEIKITLKVIEYRLKNNIKEDNSYLNKALENYLESYQILKNYKKTKLTHKEKIKYQDALSTMEVSKYILEHKQNINKENNLNYQLRTIIEDYEIFIIMIIIIISGTIICDEIRDGTIKLLLIKPYSRGKILLSKYLATTIIFILSILFLILIQVLIGGFIFGFESLKLPVVEYHFEYQKIIEYSIIKYMIIRILAKIPFLIILMMITIFIGTISNSTVISITMPLILYIFTPIIENLAIQYKLKFTKYFINTNYNLTNYLFGRLSQIEFININFSIIIIFIYFIILFILTLIIFKKKNIKNI